MEILFRGKSIISGEWAEGYYTFYPKGFSVSGKAEHVIRDTQEYAAKVYFIDPETVCQYTGLTDKNGRKIFEGDICRDGDNIVRILWNDKHQWGVKISKTDNVLSKGLVFPLWQYDNCKENGYRTLEVIGNIFDNPELKEA